MYDEDAFNYNPESNTIDESCIYHLADISHTAFADGIVEFESHVWCGICYTVVWDFGDGSYSNDYNTVHTYIDNGLFEVVLHVSGGFYDIIKSVEIVILMP